MKTKISIVDYSILTPYGDSVDSILSYLSLSTKHLPCICRKIDGYDASKYLGNKGSKYLTMQTKLLLSSIIPLWKRRKEFVQNEELGIVTASCFASTEDLAELGTYIQEGDYNKIPPMNSFNFSLNIPSSIASIKTQAQAFNVTLTSGISSGYDAICFALDNLKLNIANQIIVSGVEYIGNYIYNQLKIEHSRESFFSDLTENSSSILFTTDSVKECVGKIICYNNNFAPNIDDKFSIDIYKNNIKNTIDEAEGCKIDLIISGTCGNANVISIENEIIHIFFPDIPIIRYQDMLGKLLSSNGIVQYILACSILKNNKFYNCTAQKDSIFHNILIIYMGFDGYIYSSVISK